MLTRMIIRNFKCLGEVEVELGSPVVFIGPNNSGKTTALQALTLWSMGLKRWQEKRSGTMAPEKRPGVTINRRDLVALPVPDANLLWRNLHTRDVQKGAGTQQTRNVRIEIIVEGVNTAKCWKCGLEFDYANAESLYCRPVRLNDDNPPQRMPVPEEANTEVAFLPPMSGLADREFVKQPGETAFLVGQGRTAEVLRNLCIQVHDHDPDGWRSICSDIQRLFGSHLDAPRVVSERSEIQMTYAEHGIRLDLASSGRGMQQALLLLAYLMTNPGSVLLLDEPDAHLEILRQRQVYGLLCERALEHRCQIVVASHSEIILNEAAGKDLLVSFVGKPHRIDDRGSQTMKSLVSIGFEQYYQAEQTGWVLYLEGSTDLAILRAFARILVHPAAEALEKPFVRYTGNNLPSAARDSFFGLREACPNLIGIAIFDRLPPERTQSKDVLQIRAWKRREIENYFCTRDTLLRWARNHAAAPGGVGIFEPVLSKAMDDAITEVENALKTLGKPSPWSDDLKVSDDFLPAVFKRFYELAEWEGTTRKSAYYLLADHVDPASLDPEVNLMLDEILRTSHQAATIDSMNDE